MRHSIIILILFFVQCCGMRKDTIEHRKTGSTEGAPSRTPLSALFKSSSEHNSPAREASMSGILPEKDFKKSSSAGGSPTGSRLGAKSVGRRDSIALAHLRQELDAIEKNYVEEKELLERYEKILLLFLK